MAGYALSEAMGAGRLRYIPVRLSAMRRFLTEGPELDVLVVAGVRRGDGFAYRRSAGWAPAAAERARRIVVELDEDGPDLGTPDITGPITSVVPRQFGPYALPPYALDPVTEAIARRVAGLLPEEPTLQFGPSPITEGVLRVLDRPAHVWSGLVTEAVLDLRARGLLLSPAVGTHLWGDQALDRAALDGWVGTRPVDETHDPGRLASIPRYVALNTAVQVGLDGSVNVERAGRRYVAGMGGHPDFAAGAARSPGGLSVIALRSEHRGRSTIVPSVDVVTTPRTDVDLVVTEHGVADLRGADDADRARRLVAVAAPAHREALAAVG
jgi:acyl-CoA hydrolase